MSRLEVSGLAELEARCQRLAVGVREKASVRAITRAGLILERAQRANAPARYGWLKISLDTKIKEYRKNDAVVAIVGPNSKYVVYFADKEGNPLLHSGGKYAGKLRKIKPSKYAHLVENGTKGHEIIIRFRNGRVMKAHIRGTPATHFMRRAMESSASQVAEVIADTIKEYVEGAN